MKVLVTGASGFICGYLVADLLNAGHEVVGVDNFSKYGPVRRSFDTDPRYRLVEGDAKDAELLTELAAGCDQVVAGAAMIGGISYFREFAYDLLARSSPAPRRGRRMASRSSPPNTSPAARTNSTACLTPSSGPSTASGSGSAAPSATTT